MSLVVERKPIDLSTLPESLHKHLDPTAPLPLKMMAARGMLPAAPEQNVRILYALTQSAEEEVAAEAAKSFADLPPEIVLPVIQKETHEGVLDWIAEARQKDLRAIEAVVMNRATHDHTVARMARGAEANMCDIIATNQVRILQAPIILEQLYQNPNARMATVDRLLELVQREGIELHGLPGVQQVINSGQAIFGQVEDSDEKSALFASEARRAEDDAARLKDIDQMSRAERERLMEEEEEKHERSSGMLHDKIARLNISEKVRLATIGSREALNLLIRDPNKLVHMAAIRSPRAQDVDFRRWARNKTLPDGVIAHIANQRELTRHYDVMLALCQNPKTPLAETLKFLNHIRTNDLKQLATDRNISMQVARQAKQLYTKRSSGR